MSKPARPYPRMSADATGTGVVSHAGTLLLLRTAEKTGLTCALSTALAPWRKPLATHDPGKIVLDLAVTLALGGDCLADIAQLRAHPKVFGSVASDPTVSRLVAVLAADAPKALAAINTARRAARSNAWAAAREHAPDHHADAANPLVIDLDATLVTAHSDKEKAAPNYKRGYGFHPLCAFVDHGDGGTGEPVAMLLRAGNAGSNTAADHITGVNYALAQLPSAPGYRVGRAVLIRTDGAGGTHAFIEYLTKRRLGYSVGFGLTDAMAADVALIPAGVWTPAYDADGKVRDGAWSPN
ncbi:Transposase DDE domain-containing protein [Prescottella defluvii]